MQQEHLQCAAWHWLGDEVQHELPRALWVVEMASVLTG